jgi:multiple sugar transport system substrate-binding protein
MNNFVTFYNKDIFNKFGAPYPKDGMMWDDYYDLAKTLTRTDGGVDYHGFVAHAGLNAYWNQLSLSWLDRKVDKAAVNTEPWQKLVLNLRRFYEIPGNGYVKVDDFKKGYIAIDLHVTDKLITWHDENPDIDFDIVSAPTLPKAPKTGYQPNTVYWFVTKTSQHKDLAFQAAAYLLSDEVQAELSRQSLVTPLVSKKVHDEFGKDLPQLTGKNTGAVFYNKLALSPPARAADLIQVGLSSNFEKALSTMYESKEDVNTTLRKLEESFNKQIDAAKAAKNK